MTSKGGATVPVWAMAVLFLKKKGRRRREKEEIYVNICLVLGGKEEG